MSAATASAAIVTAIIVEKSKTPTTLQLRFGNAQPASVAYKVAHPPGVWELMGLFLGTNGVIAKDVKSCTY